MCRYAERAAEEAGRHPRLVRRGDGTRGRELREEDDDAATNGRAGRDVRWGLLEDPDDADDADADADDPSVAKWSWLETMGNATSHSTAQFLVATDGGEGTRVALAAALASATAGRAAVVGYIPTASFAVVGTPAAAAAAEAVPGVLWVGPLTPADRTARAWDVILPLLADVYKNFSAARKGTGGDDDGGWNNATGGGE